MPTAREALDKTMLEDDLLHQVTDLLSLTGWEWFHDNAVNMPGAHMNRPGFPDIVAVHPRTGHVLVLELKREGERLRPAQEEWALAWEAADKASAGLVRYFVAMPHHWSQLEGYIRSMAVTTTTRDC